MRNIVLQIAQLEQRILRLLIPKDEADDRNAILEIRAGSGGEEASLFVGNLFQMYARYAQLQGWRFETLEACPTPLSWLHQATDALCYLHIC